VADPNPALKKVEAVEERLKKDKKRAGDFVSSAFLLARVSHFNEMNPTVKKRRTQWCRNCGH
jgi:hypothetical protein